MSAYKLNFITLIFGAFQVITRKGKNSSAEDKKEIKISGVHLSVSIIAVRGIGSHPFGGKEALDETPTTKGSH